MEIVALRDFRSRDSVAVLTHLLGMAKRGELSGVAVCALHTNGEGKFFFADAYRKSPDKIALAASRMYWRSMQIRDEVEAARK